MLFKHALGEVLRTARQEQGLTLRQTAGYANIALGYLSEVERGHKEISSELFENLADALAHGTAELVIKTGVLMSGVSVPDTAETLLDEYSDLVVKMN
jgi:transcriptional regulator with XRE-family HTH domain